MYLQGRGANPYERQQAAAERREQATQAVLKRLRWPLRGWFQKSLKWAQENGPAREDSLADLGLAHPQIRRVLGELGARLVAAGAIPEAEDIYWLEERELRELAADLEAARPLPDLSPRLPARRAEWYAAFKANPPVMLPEKMWMTKLIPWSRLDQGEGQTTFKGMGTSGGVVTGTARVLFGPEDFSRFKPGDVLVAVTTTPAWTPLFAMASAVVTDIGGPLSHSSIVAREYGIPAVMATGVATRRIRDGQSITVDGRAGVVSLNGK
jgi:pyruvate,water dikinase